MNKAKSIIYLTYQTFPAKTANSIQTISNIKYFILNGINVTLVFPLREASSSSDLEKLQNFYNFKEFINLIGITHNYLHGKTKRFNFIFYHLSHYLWSKKTILNLYKNDQINTFFTRSDWVAYFLAKQNSKVVFEIHQVSKLRKFIVKNLSSKQNVKFIFLNELLKKEFPKVKNSIVAHNGVDEFQFSNSNKVKDKNSILFLGNTSRFKKSRGLPEIIEWFSDSRINENFKLTIVGGNSFEVKSLNTQISKLNLTKSITIHEWVNRNKVIDFMQNAEIGLLLNSPENLHSFLYSSPLKYFEYLYSRLKVVAVDFPAHRVLPLNKNISFFENGNKESFITALLNTSSLTVLSDDEQNSITLNCRIKLISDFIF